MTALAFPSSPQSGATYTGPNGTLYTYDGTKWVVTTTTITSDAVTNFIQDTAAVILTNTQSSGISFSYDTSSNQLSANVSSGTTLPTQTGNSGKYLTTNGSALSWSAAATDWSSLTGKPTFSTVATSGSYTDLTNAPVASGTDIAQTAGIKEVFASQYSDGATSVPNTHRLLFEERQIKSYGSILGWTITDANNQTVTITSVWNSNAPAGCTYVAWSGDITVTYPITLKSTSYAESSTATKNIYNWKFRSTGSLKWPDGTIQSSAYTNKITDGNSALTVGTDWINPAGYAIFPGAKLRWESNYSTFRYENDSGALRFLGWQNDSSITPHPFSSLELGVNGTTSIISTEGNIAKVWNFGFNSATFPTDVPTSMGDLTVENLTVNGTTTTINTESYTISDNIMQIADGNVANTIDIGFVAHRTVNSVLEHTGFIRDASDDKWKLFKGLTTQPGNTVDFTGTTLDTLQLGALQLAGDYQKIVGGTSVGIYNDQNNYKGIEILSNSSNVFHTRDVKIITNTDGSPNTWKFAEHGLLELPANTGGIVITGGTVEWDGSGSVPNLALSSTNSLTINTNSRQHSWEFGLDSNLTVPGNIYGSQNGNPLVLGLAVANNNAFISIPSFTDGGELLTIQNNFDADTGGIQVNTNGYLDLNGKSVNLNGSTGITATVGSLQWLFDSSGNLTLPTVWSNPPTQPPSVSKGIRFGDNTLQTTAYTGISSGTYRMYGGDNNVHYININGDGEVNIPGTLSMLAGEVQLPNSSVFRNSSGTDVTKAQYEVDSSIATWRNMRDNGEIDTVGPSYTSRRQLRNTPTGATTFENVEILSASSALEWSQWLTSAWQYQNNPGADPLWIAPAISHALYSQLRTFLSVMEGKFDALDQISHSVDIKAASAVYTFGSDSKLTLPNNAAIMPHTSSEILGAVTAVETARNAWATFATTDLSSYTINMSFWYTPLNVAHFADAVLDTAAQVQEWVQYMPNIWAVQQQYLQNPQLSLAPFTPELTSNDYTQINILLGNLLSALEVLEDLEPSTDIKIGSKVWALNSDGNITLPNGGSLKTTGNKTTLQDTTNGVQLYAGDYNSLTVGHNSSTTITTNVNKVWTFNTNGNLTAPGSITATDGNVTTSYLSIPYGGEITVATINNTDYLQACGYTSCGVRVGVDGGTIAWLFNLDGDIQLPAGGDIKDSNGNSVLVSAYTLPQATTSVLGGVRVDGTTITASSGIISAVTPNVLGITQSTEKFQTYSTSISSGATVTFDCSTGNIFYITSTVGGNWTANFTNLNIASGTASTITLIISQGATGYYPNAFQVATVAKTINWQGNTTPSVSANRNDIVTFSILNNSGTYIVFGQIAGF